MRLHLSVLMQVFAEANPIAAFDDVLELGEAMADRPLHSKA